MHADAFTSLQVELLERTAYSVRDPVRAHALGITLERQRGVHAIGSDRRADFDTWPGVLAYTPPGVEVFSESASGGEYLVVRWTCDAYAETAINANERVQWTGSSQALQAAHALRRLLLARERDTLAIEQVALTCNDPAEPAQFRRLMQMLEPGFSWPAPGVDAGGYKSVSNRQSHDWHAVGSRTGAGGRIALSAF